MMVTIYSASIMHLVIYGKEKIDYLQSLVERTFCDIRNTGREALHFPGHPCSTEHTQILVKAVPIKQGHKLRIIWPTSPYIRHYKEGPAKYMGHLIGHEAEGSLFYALKKLGWAISLSAGESESSLEYSFFSVVIELTDLGNEHVEDVVGLLFRYIALLKESGNPKWIFDELLAICEAGFHYRDKSPPIHYVVNISSVMQIFPPEDWLIAWSMPSKYAPDILQKAISELNSNNVRIFWDSKTFEGQTTLTEPWYGTAYSVENISATMIQKWVEKAPKEDLHLPQPNIFIPTDFSLKLFDEKISFPIMARRTLCSQLWYKPDTKFQTPKAYVKIDFNCPLSNYSPEAVVLTNLFTRLLTDYLNEFAYDAEVAGLHYSVKLSDTGFKVTLVGYNHKMTVLLENIVGRIGRFEVRNDRFFVIKEKIKKEYENIKFQQPYQQAMEYASLILEEHTWPWNEELEVLSLIQPHDLESFVPQLLKKTFLECYIAGNVEQGEAESIVQHIEDILFNAENSVCKSLSPSQYLTKRIVKLDKGLRYYYPAKCLNQQDENSALVHYIQVHQDAMKLNVLLQLFALVAKQPAFHQLRSVEQLGYITFLLKRNDYGVWGLQFIIQSTVKDPANLAARAESFLKMTENTLQDMTELEFKNNVNALIDMKLEKHKNLREESSFFWSEISNGTLKFDRRESEVAALRELQREELIEFFNNYVKVDAPSRKTLSVLVYGGLHAQDYDKVDEVVPPQSRRITDIFSFRRSRQLYGSLKGAIGQMKL